MAASSSQADLPLVNALRQCVRRDHAPFYTPGHKRGQGISAALLDLLGFQAFQADLPELPELDNLFAPTAAIQQAQELAAAAFGADRTWFLVNGSTCGVIAAIAATCQPGDKIILPRNIHQSAISGLILAGAMPVFVLPEYDAQLDIAHSVTPAAIAAALHQHPDAKAVMVVYPTYYGVCGDLAKIAEICHHHNMPLLVDEAHGAHFAFHPQLPTAALAAGADLTVQSTHKTLAGMTQAAMLHLQGDRIDPERLSKALQLVQSTSPSYLLLASLDAARHQMATQGKALMEPVLNLATWARSQIQAMPEITVLQPEQAGMPGFQALDLTRLTVTVTGLGINGFTADKILHTELSVTAELPSLKNLTFIISLGNTQADVERLVSAFKQLAGRRNWEQEIGNRPDALSSSLLPFTDSHASFLVHCAPLTPREAFFAPAEAVSLTQAVGRISAELVCPYPPGIPVLVPGERIAAAAISYLQTILSAGGSVTGWADPTLQSLKVVCK